MDKFNEIEKADLVGRAVTMRAQKRNWREIAEALGVAPNTARNWVSQEIKGYVNQDDLEAVKAEELQTLDSLEENALALIRSGLDMLPDVDGSKVIISVREDILKCQAHVLNIQARRAKLLGLDAPQKLLHGIQIRKDYDAEIEGLLQQLVGGGRILTDPETVVIDGEVSEG